MSHIPSQIRTVQANHQLNPTMPADKSEKRVATRSQFFLLQSGGELVSFYSFRPENSIDAVPALVVDLSESGLQILTTNVQPLTQQSFSLELVTSEQVGSGKRYGVHKVWSRLDGVNTRTGFAFDDGFALLDEVEVLLSTSERHVLRCVLYPS
jgi:hypothetical protein